MPYFVGEDADVWQFRFGRESAVVENVDLIDVEILDQSVCHAAGFCRNISGGETAVVQCRDGSAVVVFGHIDDCCAG